MNDILNWDDGDDFSTEEHTKPYRGHKNMLAAAKDEPISDGLTRIHAWWIDQDNIRYLRDGDNEYIQSQQESLKKGTGNCNDVAAGIAADAVAIGISPENIYLCRCAYRPDTADEEPHMVAMIADKIYDNTSRSIEYWFNRNDLKMKLAARYTDSRSFLFNDETRELRPFGNSAFDQRVAKYFARLENQQAQG